MSHPATYRSGTVRVQSRGTAGRLPGGTTIFTVSRQQFMKHPGYAVSTMRQTVN
ncbi:MAG: hypothetical protein P8075_02675 [Deltaproteobacteria bacterium]